MSTETIPKTKWVAGVVNFSLHLGRDFPHAFFEIDTTDEASHKHVLDSYKRFNIDCVSQRIGNGYHYFGNAIDRQIWREWYLTVKELNYKYPPLTLRITKKFRDEVFERPAYHEAQQITPNWSRALMHFLNKEIRGENNTDLHKAMESVGLKKYFKTVVYKVELK